MPCRNQESLKCISPMAPRNFDLRGHAPFWVVKFSCSPKDGSISWSLNPEQLSK